MTGIEKSSDTNGPTPTSNFEASTWGPIRDSWHRCQASGLSQNGGATRRSIPWRELCRLYDADVQLRTVTRPILHKLHEELGKSRFTLAFANRDCVVVDGLPADRGNGTQILAEVQVGACWDELSRGTNAIAIAARSEQPAVVGDAEHFSSDYNRMTCVAVPVFGVSRVLIGVLDASTVSTEITPHQTISLLQQAAQRIEAALFCEAFRTETILHFHVHRSFVHTADAGLVAFDNDGVISGYTRNSLALLSLDSAEQPSNIRRLFKGDSWRCPANFRPSRFINLEGKAGGVFVGALEPPEESHTDYNAKTSNAAPNSHALISRDTRIDEQLQLIERAVTITAPILITGETGTGKELVARFVHTASGRDGHFVAVNSAALPPDLIEAELFGYSEGAFTGARAGGSPGLVVEADGGTLFIDEIGDMPFQLQATMLRLLDYWAVRPVGSNQERSVDVQLVCATNCDLSQAVADGHFRADLWHRINVVEVELPPIRDRSDFSYLVSDLLNAIDPSLMIEDEAIACLQTLPWPGNARELRNALTRLALQTSGSVIDRSAVVRSLPDAALAAGTGTNRVKSALDVSKQKTIVEVYFRNNCNVSATARELKVSRTTIYGSLRKAGIN